MTQDRTIKIRTGGVVIAGDLAIPSQPEGMVVIAHGSGSGRRSSRNRLVAGVLHEHHMGTLLLDLLTEEEQGDEGWDVDLEVLGARVAEAVFWLSGNPETEGLPIGLYGASTGAAVAIIAAVRSKKGMVRTIVSRGGRPDLASDVLYALDVPILFLVGSEDDYVLELNEVSMKKIAGVKRLEVIEGAGHLFEEPGTLQKVADLTVSWFVKYLKEGS